MEALQPERCRKNEAEFMNWRTPRGLLETERKSQNMMRRLIIGVFLIALLGIAFFLAKSNGDRNVPASFSSPGPVAEYHEQSLGLTEPVQIASWRLFADGGTTALALKSPSGPEVWIYYDLSGEGIKENRHIYVGKYSDPNAKRVPIGSNVEQEIVRYVCQWMEKEYPEFRKDPESILTDNDGYLINAGSIVGLIEDLEKRKERSN
jgi:hypothetical protein